MTPSEYFDLSTSSFQELFSEKLPVWDALKQIRSWLKSQKHPCIQGYVAQGAYLEGEIWIGKGTVVESGAYLKGPVWIGENCQIRHGSYIRGFVLADDEAVIGHDTEVKNAIFLKGAHAAHFAYVGDSILGNKVNLGAGVVLANLRLKGDEIAVAGAKTGLRKFGAIVGDNTQIGCNTVLNPGTLVGKEVEIYPLVNAGGLIPFRSRVRALSTVEVSCK